MRKSLLLTLLAIYSVNSMAKADFYAGENIDYSSVVIKLSDQGLKDIGEGIQSRNGGQSLSLYGSDGIEMRFEKLFKETQRSSLIGRAGNANGLNKYFVVKIPDEKSRDAEYINNIVRMFENDKDVDIIYPAAKPVSMDKYVTESGETRSFSLDDNKSVSPERNTDGIPSFVDRQDYLKSPNDRRAGYVLGGINALNLHKHYPGSKGEGVTVMSNEDGQWGTDHIDLPKALFSIGGNDSQDHSHGTMSVGIMVGKDNGFGVLGIAHKAQLAYADWAVSDFIRGINLLKAGDVVQLGQQGWTPLIPASECSSGKCYLPVEHEQAWFDAIKTATDSGIHVIMAAGNGNVNLDNPKLNGKFDRNVRDSGGIIAGAVCAEDGKKAYFSTYGSRVDSAAWGCWDVVTTTSHNISANLWDAPNAQYTRSFAGTSSANPIIAGAAASLSGMAKHYGKSLSPKQLRKLLTDTGTPLVDTHQPIGTQPDVMKAAEKMLGETPADESLTISNLRAEIIDKGHSTLSFNAQAEGNITLEAEVVSQNGVKKGAIIQTIENDSTTVKIALTDVTAGKYALKYKATNEQGEPIKQESLSFTLMDAASAPTWDSSKAYDKLCTKVTYDGKEWMNGWWTQGDVPGAAGEWGVWRVKGAANMHPGC
ncbi:Alkaline protease precursor [Serratia quinivorans]|uniref:S8 family serine peptidase n=1 Tax=Serratia quinivorans TaxID=137545 RepID=UPI00217B664A|nr:S8 family serine peptidase [Serratia quinivorans]CAI2002817.1 Alkaline protease precursor [Serratia quinivorans]